MPISAIQARRQRLVGTDAPSNAPKKRKVAAEVCRSLSPPPNFTPGRATSPPVRGFSPSFPVDSSEDSSSRAVHDIGVSDSLQFVPKVDKNVFHLDEDEIANIFGEFVTGNPCTLIALELGETFYFHGAVRLLVLGGAVSLMGAHLHSSPSIHNVFAPRSHPIPSITSLQAIGSHLALGLPSRAAAIHPSATFVAIIPDISGIESLERTSSIFTGLFDLSTSLGIRHFQIVEPRGSAAQTYRCPFSWRSAIDEALAVSSDSIERPFICLVQGPKNSGKSTFARALLNSFTSQSRTVAYLDCDLGQSEFAIPGQVSLHLMEGTVFGPPFTHPLPPYRAHFLGSPTSKSDPERFLASIESLLKLFLLEIQYQSFDDGSTQHPQPIQPIPLIINTQGWAKGLGASLLDKIHQLAKPTFVYGLHQADAATQSFETPYQSDCHYRLLECVSSSEHNVRLTASDLRGLSIMSYFHSSMSSDGSISWDTRESLGSRRPWEIDRNFFRFVAFAGPESQDIVDNELENALSAGLVGLIRLDEDPLPHSMPYQRGTTAPSPEVSECLGLGLVRFISSRVLHLITPVGSDALSRCRGLVKGELELPIGGFLDYGADAQQEENNGSLFGVECSDVPFLQWSSVAVGAGSAKRRVRRNVMRRGQM